MPVQKAFICIPDITGFTDFINAIEIEHAQKIIPVILRNLANTNMLDMEVAEIQGDAIVFYRIGEAPEYEQVIKQCRRFFENFKYNINILEEQYRDLLGAYDIREHLGLKIVVHYGDVVLASVVGITKLYGKDVIKSLELLKNSISHKEYMLISEGYLSTVITDKNNFDLSPLTDGEDNYNKIGNITYKYISATELLEIK